MKHIYIFLIAGILLIASSCNLINPAEPIPAYIHIEKIGLTTTSEQGSNSSKITDAWVYMDGALIGCFELPVTFPVIADNGMHNFVIKPGIKVNGIAATRAPYPFYNSYNTTISLTKGVVTTMSPMVTYVSNINWNASAMWKEDFEDSGITTDTSPSSGVNTVIERISRTTDAGSVFEGDYSGIAYLNNSNHSYCEVINTSPNILYLPGGSSPVFLEMNYKCNYPFTVGLFAYSAGTSVKMSIINLHSTSDVWNKVYVYVTPQISAASNPIYFNMFLGMLNTDNAPNPYFAVDNIKLVHYQ